MTTLVRTFVLRNEAAFQNLYAFLKVNWFVLSEQGKPLSITVEKHKAKRNYKQNKRYWKILNCISECAWVNGKQFSPRAWHEEFKGMFIGYEETPSGKLSTLSTTDYSTAEFAEYMDLVEAYAVNELGIELQL